MEKGVINIRTVTANEEVYLQDVIQVSISNYSLEVVNLTIKGVTIEIPMVTKILGTDVPSLPFKFDCLGLPFDEKFLIEFVTTGVGKVIVGYTTKKNC